MGTHRCTRHDLDLSGQEARFDHKQQLCEAAAGRLYATEQRIGRGGRNRAGFMEEVAFRLTPS